MSIQLLSVHACYCLYSIFNCRATHAATVMKRDNQLLKHQTMSSHHVVLHLHYYLGDMIYTQHIQFMCIAGNREPHTEHTIHVISWKLWRSHMYVTRQHKRASSVLCLPPSWTINKRGKIRPYPYRALVLCRFAACTFLSWLLRRWMHYPLNLLLLVTGQWQV
jgi:hypothetical protein